MSAYDLIRQLEKLHVKTTDYKGHDICDHCAYLCHSHSGLGCDDVDGEWPCDTMKIVQRYELA